MPHDIKSGWKFSDENPPKGEPEEILDAAKALLDHKHDGSDASDLLWDFLLDDLRWAIDEYDKRYGGKK